MEVLEAIKTRRSVRTFTDTPIENDTLHDLIEAGVWAPSGGNMQSWRFVVISKPDQLENIRNLSPGIFGHPTAIITVCSDLAEAEEKGGPLGSAFLAPTEAAMAAQNILLAAHAKGLGACVIASFHAAAVQRLLKLPKSIKPLLLIILGYPLAIPKAPVRKVEEIIWLETYCER